MSEKVDLYLGAYFNYGLNNIITPDTKLMFQPNGVYNGVFSSTQTNDVKTLFSRNKSGDVFENVQKEKYKSDCFRTN